MLLIGSANAAPGMADGWRILQARGSALDAVEAAVNRVEDHPEDRTVGYGGLPNLLGEVELDASIMDGATRRVGAVAALKGYRHAITVARAVMERTPHVLLAGDGAARLAAEVGLPAEDLLTSESSRIWREGVEAAGIEGDAAPLHELAHLSHAHFQSRLVELLGGDRVGAAVRRVTDPGRSAGTVNVLAIDAEGRIASGVSTSGWPWCHPGRVGDSSVIGAGNYADARYGAAGCTGSGELAIRAGTARAVVEGLRCGMRVEEACENALLDLCALNDVAREHLMMNIVAVDAGGRWCAASTYPSSTYVVQHDGLPEPEVRPRTAIEVPGPRVARAPAARAVVHTSDAPGPTAGAPYAQAIRAGGLVFVSGQLPVDPDTGALVEGGIVAQTQQALDNLAAVLAASGSDLGRLVKTTVFLRTRDDWPAMNEVYRRAVGDSPPARTAVEVGRLGHDALVEIDAVAVA
jgi:beta-aspartyl-peptidase (threonine type)